MSGLKIVHICTFRGGGAAIAAMRLHDGLLNHDYESKFLFLDKGEQTATVIQYHKKIYLWKLALRILKKLGLPLNLEQKNDYAIRKYKYKMELFSFANTPYIHLHEHPLIKEADIVHLHWIANFVDYKTFFPHIKQPIVWTLHDMNPFQGGFHYKEDENRFGKALQQLNTEQYSIKKDALHQLSTKKITVVAPSLWLHNLAKQSEILGRFVHRHIPYGINTNIFKVNASNNKNSRQKINVLFVAESLHNYRKGFDMVQELLEDKTITDVCHFTTVGSVKKSARIPQITYLGSIYSETEMSKVYNEADVFLLPSREDNLPNTMVESLCCGTPVVGFAVGGLTETIQNGENGYLSPEVSSIGLKKALLSYIRNKEKFDRTIISENARRKFASEGQVADYAEVYNACLKQSSAQQTFAE